MISDFFHLFPLVMSETGSGIFIQIYFFSRNVSPVTDMINHIIKAGASVQKQHFTVVAGLGGANLYFLSIYVAQWLPTWCCGPSIRSQYQPEGVMIWFMGDDKRKKFYYKNLTNLTFSSIHRFLFVLPLLASKSCEKLAHFLSLRGHMQ